MIRFEVGIVCNQVTVLRVIHFKERIRRNRDKVRISEQIEEIRNDAFFGCFVNNCPGIEALLLYVRVPESVDIVPSPSKVLELCEPEPTTCTALDLLPNEPAIRYTNEVVSVDNLDVTILR